MNRKYGFILWGGLFVLCAGLGFVRQPEGLARLALTGISVAFFLPPVWLLLRAKKEGSRDTCLLIRNLSAMSLGLTLLALVGNFIMAVSTESLGNFLHAVLVVVSTPMICSGYWALSLFLWACLLIASVQLLKTGKNNGK